LYIAKGNRKKKVRQLSIREEHSTLVI